MKPLEVPALTAEQVEAVAQRYRTTHHVRLRTRAQLVLLAAEQQLGVREIATIVRECAGTVRCWLKRFRTHGIDGLQDQWAGGAPAKVTPAYRDQLLQLVRRRPRSLDLPTYPLPPGPCNDWRTCWRSGRGSRGSGWSKKPCVSTSKPPRSSCVGRSIPAGAQIPSMR